MKASQVRQCFYFLKFLQSLPSKVRNQIFETPRARPLCAEIYDTLSGVLYNIDQDKIKNASKIKPLIQRKRLYRKFVSPKFNRKLNRSKKAAILSQAGGFLSFILPVVASLVGEVVTRYVWPKKNGGDS